MTKATAKRKKGHGYGYSKARKGSGYGNGNAKWYKAQQGITHNYEKAKATQKGSKKGYGPAGCGNARATGIWQGKGYGNVCAKNGSGSGMS